MRALLSVFFIFSLFSSCSKKAIVLSSVNSQRGDAVFSMIVPDNNYGKLADIHIYAWTQGGDWNINRVLVDFDLDKIPTDAEIDKVFLDLYFNPNSAYDRLLGNKGNQGESAIIIQRVTSNWQDTTVTWNLQPKTTADNQIVIPRAKNPKANYTSIDVTSLIKDMKGYGAYGFMIRHQIEHPYNVTFFASSNHHDKSLHPQLRVYLKKK